MAEIGALVDGPDLLGGWREKEGRRRRAVYTLLLKLLGFASLVGVFQYFAAHLVLLNAAACTLLAAGVSATVLRFALDDPARPGCLPYVLVGGVGSVVSAALWLGRWPGVGLVLYPAAAALALAALGELVVRGFGGWCCSVPDRDVMVRWRWHAGLRHLADPRHVPDRRTRWVLQYGWCVYATALLPAAVAVQLVLHVGRRMAESRGLPLPLDPLGPVPAGPLYAAGFVLGCAGLFAAGCLVARLARVATPGLLLAVTWRALVVWLTYDMDRAGRHGTYRFGRPFGDYRLRWLLAAAVVLLGAVAAVSALQLPRPFTTFDPSAPLAGDPVGEILATAATVLGTAGGVMLCLFVMLAGSVGPVLTLYYFEFAHGAVSRAERGAP